MLLRQMKTQVYTVNMNDIIYTIQSSDNTVLCDLVLLLPVFSPSSVCMWL